MLFVTLFCCCYWTAVPTPRRFSLLLHRGADTTPCCPYYCTMVTTPRRVLSLLLNRGADTTPCCPTTAPWCRHHVVLSLLLHRSADTTPSCPCYCTAVSTPRRVILATASRCRHCAMLSAATWFRCGTVLSVTVAGYRRCTMLSLPLCRDVDTAPCYPCSAKVSVPHRDVCAALQHPFCTALSVLRSYVHVAQL